MATPGQLQQRIAEAFGIPENAVAYPWRVLRDNGEVTTGARGRNAPPVTSRDAANILIAVAGSLPVTETIQTFRAFTELRAAGAELVAHDVLNDVAGNWRADRSGAWQLERLYLPKLRALPAGASFRDTLEALIASTANGDVQLLIDQPPEDIRRSLKLEVRLSGPQPHAQIEISVTDYTEIMRFSPEKRPESRRADLKQIRFFTQETLFSIAGLIKLDLSSGGLT